jgi:hypothetical protein
MSGQAFQYNDRVAAALVPALLVYAAGAEPAVLAILLVRSLLAALMMRCWWRA